MYPIIPESSFVLIKNYRSKPKIGSIVIFNHVKLGKLVKKLTFIDKDGNFWFTGKNKNSVSSKKIGPITSKNVIGIVLIIIKPNKFNF